MHGSEGVVVDDGDDDDDDDVILVEKVDAGWVVTVALAWVAVRWVGRVADVDDELGKEPAQREERAGMEYGDVWHWLVGWLYNGVAVLEA